MGRILLAGVIGGLVIFVWSSVSWMFLGWHNTSGGKLTNEAAVVEVLRAGGAETGVYWLPGMNMESMDEAAQTAWAERHRAGPVGVLIYHADGVEPMAPIVFVKGLLIDVVAAGLVALLLSLAAGSIAGYVGRVAFVVGFGVLFAVYSDLTLWNFMYFPTDWTLVTAADHIVTWFWAGLAIAAVVKGKTPPPE